MKKYEVGAYIPCEYIAEVLANGLEMSGMLEDDIHRGILFGGSRVIPLRKQEHRRQTRVFASEVYQCRKNGNEVYDQCIRCPVSPKGGMLATWRKQ